MHVYMYQYVHWLTLHGWIIFFISRIRTLLALNLLLQARVEVYYAYAGGLALGVTCFVLEIGS